VPDDVQEVRDVQEGRLVSLVSSVPAPPPQQVEIASQHEIDPAGAVVADAVAHEGGGGAAVAADDAQVAGGVLLEGPLCLGEERAGGVAGGFERLGDDADLDAAALELVRAVLGLLEDVQAILGGEDREGAEAADRHEESIGLAVGRPLFEHLDAHPALGGPGAVHRRELRREAVRLGVGNAAAGLRLDEKERLARALSFDVGAGGLQKVETVS